MSAAETSAGIKRPRMNQSGAPVATAGGQQPTKQDLLLRDPDETFATYVIKIDETLEAYVYSYNNICSITRTAFATYL